MALRAGEKDKEYQITLENDAKAFSMNVFREANSFRLFLKSGNSDPVILFKAYYNGMFSFTAGLNISAGGGDMLSMFTGFNEGLTRSIVRGVTKSLTGTMSGTFAAPLKPFIKGTEPLQFTLKGFLPLIVKGDGTDSFQENIQTPISSLLGITLPWKSTGFANASNKFAEGFNDVMNWMFNGTEGSTIWTAVQGAVNQIKEDFLGGIYLLNEPLQYTNGNDIILRIGPWRVTGLIIERIEVQYSSLMFTDGSDVYPAYAIVNITCKTKLPATPDMLGLWADIQNNNKPIADIINPDKNKYVK